MQTEEDILNIHASTQVGKLFIGAEYIEIQTENTAGLVTSMVT